MDKKEIDILLDKYLKGNCTPQEAAILEEFFDSFDEDIPWKSSELGDQREFKENLYSHIREHIRANQKKEGPKFTARALKVAAIFMLISVAGLWIYHQQALKKEHPEIVWRESTTKKGEKLTVTLNDGTSIKLNSASILKYPNGLVEGKRMVILQGEAFFEVAENPKIPFQVRTNGLYTTVLGTSFNIRALPGEGNIKVAVKTGSVRVSSQHGEGQNESARISEDLVLLPDEMATYSKQTGETEKTLFDERQVFSWKDGILIFNNNNIQEVISTLEKWYGVEFNIQGSINRDKDFSGAYEKKPLKAVMEGLSFVYDFDYEIDENTVTLK